MAGQLIEKYRSNVTAVLKDRFGYKNVNAIPKLTKIVVSMGIGNAHSDQAKLENAGKQLGLITGQRPVVTKARKSVSNFNLRRGMSVGLMVTLRGARMYEFFDRLVSLAIPRVKDFRGLNPSSFDGHGNYNMGLIEQAVFPEVDPASVTFTQGMNISISTTAKTDEEALELLRELGMPFRRD